MFYSFFSIYPACLYGLSAFLGASFCLLSPLALIPMIFLLLNKKHLFAAVFFFLLPIVYIYHFYSFPQSGSYVTGKLKIDSIRERDKFSKGWLYNATLTDGKKRIICKFTSKEKYSGSYLYNVEGIVFSNNHSSYFLRQTKIEPLKKRFGLADLRYDSKKFLKRHLKKHFEDKKTANFLSGIVSGELDDSVISQEFGMLGLSHILAISGFHFVVITYVFHCLLSLVLRFDYEAFVLMILLTLYFLFVGDSPSIQRAWIIVMLFLLGKLVARPSYTINSLGVAMMAATFLNPTSVITPSFQLSFLATFGIILINKPLGFLLQFWIPTIKISDIKKCTLARQHCYLISILLRKSLTLILSVHLAVAPLILYLFHTLSINSLIYNLFFPFLVSVVLFLLVIGMFTFGVTYFITGWLCKNILLLTHFPVTFKTFYFESVPSWILVAYTTVLFGASIIWHEREICIERDA